MFREGNGQANRDLPGSVSGGAKPGRPDLVVMKVLPRISLKHQDISASLMSSSSFSPLEVEILSL